MIFSVMTLLPSPHQPFYELRSFEKLLRCERSLHNETFVQEVIFRTKAPGLSGNNRGAPCHLANLFSYKARCPSEILFFVAEVGTQSQHRLVLSRN